VEVVVKYILLLISLLLNNLNLIRDLKVDNLNSFKETCKKLPFKYIINKDNLLFYKSKLYI
jgi:hypothetical protein